MAGPPFDPNPGEPRIATRRLTKRFHDTVALADLDLRVSSGTVLAVLGLRGAGKTTLMRLLCGLARPSAGAATIAGATVGGRAWLTTRRRLGVAFADPTYHAWMTGRDVVAFAAQLAGMPSSEHRARVDETLARLGLGRVAAERAATYPIALRRRLGLAQAIVAEPEVVLLDEPVASLAEADRAELLGIIGELRPEATVLFTTDAIADIEPIADRVAVLDHGRLVLDASANELLDRLAQPVYELRADRDQGPALSALGTRLRQEPWVSWVTPNAAGLRVGVSDAARAARDLLPLALAAGVRPTEFGRRRPAIDDLIDALSGDRRRDRGDHGDRAA